MRHGASSEASCAAVGLYRPVANAPSANTSDGPSPVRSTAIVVPSLELTALVESLRSCALVSALLSTERGSLPGRAEAARGRGGESVDRAA